MENSHINKIISAFVTHRNIINSPIDNEINACAKIVEILVSTSIDLDWWNPMTELKF